jgi:zinc-ribbon domain
MAGFCTNCGTPLGEAQAFCIKCGTRIGAPPQAQTPQTQPPSPPPAPAAPPPPTTAPAAAAGAPAPGMAKKSSPLVKIVLLLIAALVLFGAVGMAGVLYVGYRVRQKAREMGLTERSFSHESTLRGVDVCSWLPKEDVSQALGVEVVRVENQGGNPGCVYNVVGDAGELTMKHAAQLNKKIMSAADQKSMEDFTQKMSPGRSALGSATGNTSYPGETAVLAFAVDENGGPFVMKFTKGMLSGLGPMVSTNVPDLGDEAFDAAGAILLVRKGDKVLRITYTQCPCGLDAIVPLAKKLAGNL